MGRKKHLTLKEKKKAIEGLIEEKPERDIAKEMNRSNTAVHNVKEKYPDEIRASKSKILCDIGLTPQYTIQCIKDDIEALPQKRDKLLDMSCKISGLYEVGQEGEKTPIQVVDKQINIILLDAENKIKDHLKQQVLEGKIE